ncbi:MAG: AgmX/PglI C-terminal domain-containing protein [Polyangiales bacterium]
MIDRQRLAWATVITAASTLANAIGCGQGVPSKTGGIDEPAASASTAASESSSAPIAKTESTTPLASTSPAPAADTPPPEPSASAPDIVSSPSRRHHGELGPHPAPADDGASGPKVPPMQIVTGKVSSAPATYVADAAISKNSWRVKTCYAKALSLAPGAKGSMKIRVRVDAKGTGTATVLSSDAPEGLSTCVMAAFDSIQYPAPDGGSATVTVPITFKPTGGDK